MTVRIIGIDPGVTGAVVAIDFGPAPRIVAAHDMPVRPRGRRRTTDGRELHELLKRLIADAAATGQDRVPIAIESAQAFPGMGASSAFDYGWSNGAIDAVTGILGQPIEYLTPAHWKPLAGVVPPKRARATEARGDEADDGTVRPKSDSQRRKRTTRRSGSTKEMKAAARARAIDAFGADQERPFFPNQGHDGRIEAALMALALGLRRSGPQPVATQPTHRSKSGRDPVPSDLPLAPMRPQNEETER